MFISSLRVAGGKRLFLLMEQYNQVKIWWEVIAVRARVRSATAMAFGAFLLGHQNNPRKFPVGVFALQAFAAYQSTIHNQADVINTNSSPFLHGFFTTL